MTAPVQHTTARPSSGPRLLIKIVMILVAINVIMVVAGVALVGPDEVFTDDPEPRTRASLIGEMPLPGATEVYLERGSYDVVAIGAGLLTRKRVGGERSAAAYESRNPFPEPIVTVTRGGEAVTTTRPTTDASDMRGDYDLVSLHTFDVSAAGTYRIEATRAEAASGPAPVTSIAIGAATDDTARSSRTKGMGGLLLVFGIVGFGFAMAVLLMAMLWRFVVSNGGPTPPDGPTIQPPPWEQPPTLRR